MSKDKSELYVYIDDIIRKNSAEIETLKKIANDTNISIKYHICSSNNTTFENIYNIKLHYYDWFIITWALGSHYLLDKHHIKHSPTYKLSCLNRNCEQEHKILLASFVNKDTTMLTFQTPQLGKHFDTITQNIENKINRLHNCNSNQRTEIEKLSRFKDKLSNGNKELRQIGSNIFDGSDESTITHISDAFVDITVETLFFIDYTYFSEKVLKACLSKRPFVLVSGPNTLDVLRKLGFKTFWLWWDERYDKELDHYKRLDKIFELIEQIENMSYQELSNMLIDMESVLEHNKQNLLMLDKKFKWLTQSGVL